MLDFLHQLRGASVATGNTSACAESSGRFPCKLRDDINDILFSRSFLKFAKLSSMTTSRTRTTRTKQISSSARAGPKWGVRLACVKATMLEAVYRMLSY